MAWTVVGFTAGALVGLMASVAPRLVMASSSSYTSQVLTSNTIPDMVRRVEPMVVQITSTSKVASQTTGNLFPFGQSFPGFPQFPGFPSPFSGGGNGQPVYQEALGSGFFITSSGEIVTNDHVINGASRIMVQIPGHHHLYPAKVLGADYNIDLALLKVNLPFSVPHVTLANPQSIQVGQFAVAIGNPYGLSQTVTLGIVSAEGRPITIGNREYVNLLQTDAAINPGNSGGPLLNLAGQVVGVNTAVQTNAQGIGFAIPVSEVDRALPYLVQGKTLPQAWIGITAETNPPAPGALTPSVAGARVVSVVQGSPAAQAGLKAGDIITRFDQQPITGASSLVTDTLDTPPGTRITLTVDRNGQILTIPLTLGTKPQNLPLQ